MCALRARCAHGARNPILCAVAAMWQIAMSDDQEGSRAFSTVTSVVREMPDGSSNCCCGGYGDALVTAARKGEGVSGSNTSEAASMQASRRPRPVGIR